jgi:nucleoside-diphosphate kinase
MILISNNIKFIFAVVAFTWSFLANCTVERTSAIIKPDAVAAKHTGDIISLIEKNNFSIKCIHKTRLTRRQSKRFYAIHKGKPFFEELVNFMSSGPIIAMVLEKDDAIKSWRSLMGDTNPEKATLGTVRKLYGTNIGKNAVHGSDSKKNSDRELKFFFSDL